MAGVQFLIRNCSFFLYHQTHTCTFLYPLSPAHSTHPYVHHTPSYLSSHILSPHTLLSPPPPPPFPPPSQFLMSLAALLVLLIHLFTKPYEKMYVNVIEAAILLDLLMVTAAFLDPSNSPVPFWFSVVLVVLPYVYAVAFIGFKIAVRLW